MLNEDLFKEYLNNYKVAFANKQFDEALKWIQKALEENSQDVSANSQAGVICVVLKQFNDAMKYFQKAVELDPQNGDNLFNLGNAYFFAKDYTNALKYYSMADTVGCSDEAKSKLYYQMAVLCSVNGNVESALINYQKYEDCDGSNGVNPDVISEKVKLYLLSNDIDNALKCASQLVLVSPKDFNSYAIYFQVLLAVHKYKKAEEILNDALKYSTLSDDNMITIEFNKVSLYVSQAENDSNLFDTYYAKALEVLDNLKSNQNLEKARLNEALLTSAEIYLKLQKFDEAIECVQEIHNQGNHTSEELSNYEIDNIIEDTINSIEDKINFGEINQSELEYAETTYDYEGHEYRVIPQGTFGDLNSNDEYIADSNQEVESNLSKEMNDKLNFILLSCYSEKEDYSNALKYAKILKSNSNPYYMYYGIYVEAFANRELLSDSWESLYDEAIAFFKSKMMKNPNDRIALIFRTRLYAERGKFAKALEMSKLVSNEERESILKYIEKYQREYQNN